MKTLYSSDLDYFTVCLILQTTEDTLITPTHTQHNTTHKLWRLTTTHTQLEIHHNLHNTTLHNTTLYYTSMHSNTLHTTQLHTIQHHTSTYNTTTQHKHTHTTVPVMTRVLIKSEGSFSFGISLKLNTPRSPRKHNKEPPLTRSQAPPTRPQEANQIIRPLQRSVWLVWVWLSRFFCVLNSFEKVCEHQSTI